VSLRQGVSAAAEWYRGGRASLGPSDYLPFAPTGATT
jgi:hypothetical protein